MARLRAQERAPADAPELSFVVDGVVPGYFVRKASAEWRRLRTELEAAPAVSKKERFFYLTRCLAPSLSGAEQRAFLETAIGILEDVNHRQVLQALLARIAAREGDVDAAEAWLAYCNPRSLDLATDTAYRFAAATIAVVKGDPQGVFAQLGIEPGEVPLAREEALGCRLLRIHAREMQGEIRIAGEMLLSHVLDQGMARVKNAVARHLPLSICAQALAWVTEYQRSEADARAAAERAAARERYERRRSRLQRRLQNTPRMTPGIFAVVFAVFAAALFVVSFTWSAAMINEDLDPWFGSAGGIICPRVCDECAAPLHMRRDGTFCSLAPGAEVESGAVESTRVSFLLVVLLVMVPGFLLLFPLVLFYVWFIRGLQRAEIAQKIADAESKLAALDGSSHRATSPQG